MVTVRALFAAVAAVMAVNTASGALTREDMDKYGPASPMKCWAGDDPHWYTFNTQGNTEYQEPCTYVVSDNCPTKPSLLKHSIAINTIKGRPAYIRGAHITLKNFNNPVSSGTTTIQLTNTHIYINGKKITTDNTAGNRRISYYLDTEIVNGKEQSVLRNVALPGAFYYTDADTKYGCNCNFKVEIRGTEKPGTWTYFLSAPDHGFTFQVDHVGGGDKSQLGASQFYLNMDSNMYTTTDKTGDSRKTCGLCADRQADGNKSPNWGKGIIRTTKPNSDGSVSYSYAYSEKWPQRDGATLMAVQKSWFQSVAWVDYKANTCDGALSQPAEAVFDEWCPKGVIQDTVTKTCAKMSGDRTPRYKYCNLILNMDQQIANCMIDVCKCQADPAFTSMGLDTTDPSSFTCEAAKASFQTLEASCAFEDKACDINPRDSTMCRASADGETGATLS
eukprot:GDKI01005361.1.p1 GENE.GDKI01005361.1~~GDKI01005361.1.p1  ORF type:complete len:447 (-),score=98.92 GDKI01005361.1:19-1359(-)